MDSNLDFFSFFLFFSKASTSVRRLEFCLGVCKLQARCGSDRSIPDKDLLGATFVQMSNVQICAGSRLQDMPLYEEKLRPHPTALTTAVAPAVCITRY